MTPPPTGDLFSLRRYTHAAVSARLLQIATKRPENLQSGEEKNKKNRQDSYPRMRMDHLHKLKFASSEMDQSDLMDANLFANFTCSQISV